MKNSKHPALPHLGVALLHINALEFVARYGLPNPHALVAATRGQERPIRAPSHALDLVLMALECCDLGQQEKRRSIGLRPFCNQQKSVVDKPFDEKP